MRYTWDSYGLGMSDPELATRSRSRVPWPVVRWAPVVGPAAVTLALGTWGLDRRSMFGSEADSFWAAHLPLGRLAHLLGHVDAVHGTYYLLLHAWFDVYGLVGAGSDVLWMRVPSVIGMVLATGLTSMLATRLTGRRLTGLVAGLLFALNPTTSLWAQNGRSYALVSAAVALTMLLLLRALERPDARSRWVAFGVGVAVSGYLHEMTLLLAPAFGVALVLARVPGPTVRRWLSTTLVAGVLVTPLLYQGAVERSALSTLPTPTAGTLARLDHQLFGTSAVVAAGLAILAVIGAVPAFTAGARSGRLTLPVLAVPALVIPPALLLIESTLARPLYDARYVLYATIPACLLAASGAQRVVDVVIERLDRRPAARPLAAGGIVVVLAAVVLTLQAGEERYFRTPGSRPEDYGAAAQNVLAHKRPGDAVLFMQPSARNAELGFPHAFAGLRDIAERVTPERSGTFQALDRPVAQVLAGLRASTRVWVLDKAPLHSEPHDLAGTRALLVRDFRPVDIARFRGVVDVLYVRKRADGRG